MFYNGGVKGCLCADGNEPVDGNRGRQFPEGVSDGIQGICEQMAMGRVGTFLLL